MNTPTEFTHSTDGWTRFQVCAGAYGAQRAAWPLTERNLYDRFATTSAGQQILQPAQSLDKDLNLVGTGGASADFMARLMAMPLPPQVRLQNYAVVFWRRSVAVLLLMAALGFGNGYTENTNVDRIWQTATMTTAFGVIAQ
ncbi:MAG TPA: hypothetical protein VGF14_04070 [Alphaproteobacteria bacterium]